MGLTMKETTIDGGPVSIRAESVILASIVDGDGIMIPGALLTMCDSVGGFCCGLGALPDGWVVTTNLMLRSVAIAPIAPLVLTSEVLRKGKSSVVARVDAHDARGAFVAQGTITSAVLIPTDGVPTWERPARLELQEVPDGPHFNEWLGIDETADGVQLELVDDLRNPWGIMHGGVTGAIVDHAAAIVARRSLESSDITLRTNDVVMHYLAPAKVGPVRASGRVMGTRPDGIVVEVEVRDAGNDDRLVALAVATVATVSAHR